MKFTSCVLLLSILFMLPHYSYATPLEGEPINEANITELLNEYQLTKPDLEKLLHQVGDQVEEYTFIEDLNHAVSYYIEHAEDLAGLSNFFSYIGLSDGEVSKLYHHVTSLEQPSLFQQLTAIKKQLNTNTEEPKLISTDQKKEVFPVFNEVLNLYHLVPTYYVNSTPLKTVDHVESLNELHGKSVKIDLHNRQGDLIGDIYLTSDMLHDDFILQTSQQLLRIGETKQSINQLLNEQNVMGEAKAPYTPSLFYGAVLLLGSTVYYLFSMNRVKR
ncbi:processed acidic surface protein [Bacillus sp. AK128]